MTHPTSIDKYQIIKPLGSGHFGQVYHAFDRALKAEKAIKVLKTTDPNTFLESLKEAQILNRCNHKHIVAINEANIFRVDKELRVVLDLEYVPEGSLEAALETRWLSIRDAISYLRGALVGLEHAHSEGFLHRDIKPGNILLAPNTPKLSDFGLATQPGPAAYGSAQGYTTHLPPEFFTDRTTSQLTDIFAAGITLFRAVSNIADWRAVLSAIPNSRRHVERGTLIQSIGFESYIPSAVQRIIRKACSPNPDNRYQTASAFRQQLDRLRFAIDWVRNNDLEWIGAIGSDAFEASVDDSKNLLTVKRNGRRVTEQCRSFPTLSEALKALHEYVAETTLS
ncbi:serine/threonine protein kinase [Sulfurifustis variabilis]|uniref:Serine/threonine protein kinase n=1 Tax=Sulfurifustis variabilis TaxID=1675686 RepID=A0A1B4V361_9GAMM|nr:serine/threonine-protein kinase [Sulfurifustis variabilis]BAU47785.1 serine/threonine protein kinase [Sulfurifustis variabilis]